MPTCQGIKLDGTRCRFNAHKDLEELFCGHHKRQYYERRTIQKQMSQALPIGLHSEGYPKQVLPCPEEKKTGRATLHPQEIRNDKAMPDELMAETEVAIVKWQYKRSVRIVLEWLQNVEPVRKTERKIPSEPSSDKQ